MGAFLPGPHILASHLLDPHRGVFGRHLSLPEEGGLSQASPPTSSWLPILALPPGPRGSHVSMEEATPPC